MHIEFVGAAQTVTGSMHLVVTKDATVLLDCGLYQGRRRESFERTRKLPLDPRAISAVVLSHAHIDHSGALPTLVKMGYDGPIYTTPATRDPQKILAGLLAEAGHGRVAIPAPGDRLAID
jgi:metallo-beta-lactamase family protein